MIFSRSGAGAKTAAPQGWQLVVIVAVVAALGIMPLSELALALKPEGVFWAEFYIDIFSALLSALVVIVTPLLVRIAYNCPWRVWGEKLIKNRPALIGVAFLGYIFIMKWATRDIAYSPDEYCALLQARTLASLHLSPQVDPQLVELVTPKWMQGHFILISKATGSYSATYWPGYALLMAPFAAAGVPWLCNTVLSVFTFLLMWALGKRLTQREEGGMWALILTIFSGQIAIQAGTYYSMPAHLLFNLLFCWFIINNTARSTFAAGLIGGYALILHNPAPHLCFALPWIVWIALKRRRQLLPLLIGYALIALPVGIGWSAYLGRFDPDPYVLKAAAQGNNAGTFSAMASRVLYILKPPDALLLLSRIAGIVKWIIWAVPGAAGLALLGYLQVWAVRKNARIVATEAAPIHTSREISHQEASQYLWLMGASVVATLALYLVVRYDQGHGWGYRYIHPAWMTFPLLAAAFLTRQTGEWKRLGATLCLGGTLLVLPAQVWQMHTYFNDIVAIQPPAPPSSPSITFLEARPRALSAIQQPVPGQLDWILMSTSPQQNSKIARYYLRNARRVRTDKWSETWVGDSIAHSGSPQNN